MKDERDLERGTEGRRERLRVRKASGGSHYSGIWRRRAGPRKERRVNQKREVERRRKERRRRGEDED